MKRLCIAGGILLALCAAALANVWFLDRRSDELSVCLAQAQALAEEGSWDSAARLTEQAERRFRNLTFYLHITLRHNDIDAVEISFREVEQLLAHRDRPGAYAAANARLMQQLELLAESEHVTLRNIL